MLTNALLSTSRSTAVLEEWCTPRMVRWPPKPKHPYQRISIVTTAGIQPGKPTPPLIAR